MANRASSSNHREEVPVRSREEVKHARLPDHMRQTTIRDLENGAQAYVRPTDMWADNDGYLWIDPRAMYSSEPVRYQTMKIIRVPNGFVVWPVAGYLYIPQPEIPKDSVPVRRLREGGS